MSAAATPARKGPKGPESNPLPPSYTEGRGFVPVLWEIQEHLYGCLSSSVVCQVFARGYARSVGSPSHTPYWNETQENIAEGLGVTLNTVNSALDELTKLGADELGKGGLIEKEKFGNRVRYKFPAAAPLRQKVREIHAARQPRRKSAAVPIREEVAEAEIECPRADCPLKNANVAHGEEKAKSTPNGMGIPPDNPFICTTEIQESSVSPATLIVLPGQAARPVTLGAAIREVRLRNAGDEAIEAVLTPGNVLEITVRAAPAARNLDEMRNRLNQLLSSTLGPVDDKMLAKIRISLGGAPLESLAAKIVQRAEMFTGRKGTWGGVVVLAQDTRHAWRESRSAQRGEEEARRQLDEEFERSRREILKWEAEHPERE